jgi:hypothetical protein
LTSSLPMGVISLNFIDYVVKVYVMIFLPFHLVITSSSIGCALSAPDGSSPRGYVWILVVKHRLKIHVFSSCWRLLFWSPRVQVEVFIPYDRNLLFLFFFLLLILSSAVCRILTSIVKYVYGPCFSMRAQQHMLINKAPSGKGKTLIRFLLRRIIFSLHLGFSQAFFSLFLWLAQMVLV